MGRRDTSADRARDAAERRAEKFQQSMLEQEKKNAARLAQMQADTAAREQALRQSAEAAQASLLGGPPKIRRQKRKPRGAGGLGRERLTIALNQKGTSTNLG